MQKMGGKRGENRGKTHSILVRCKIYCNYLQCSMKFMQSQINFNNKKRGPRSAISCILIRQRPIKDVADISFSEAPFTPLKVGGARNASMLLVGGRRKAGGGRSFGCLRRKVRRLFRTSSQLTGQSLVSGLRSPASVFPSHFPFSGAPVGNLVSWFPSTSSLLYIGLEPTFSPSRAFILSNAGRLCRRRKFREPRLTRTYITP